MIVLNFPWKIRLWKGIEACVSENNFKMERERERELVGNIGKGR